MGIDPLSAPEAPLKPPVRIGLIVEGQGDVQALPPLVAKIALAVDAYRTVVPSPRPIRMSRSKCGDAAEVARLVTLAAAESGSIPPRVLIVVDADDDCAKTLAGTVAQLAAEARRDALVAVVAAVREWEAWFLAGADSLAGRFDLPTGLKPHENPESVGSPKDWLTRQMPPGRSYSPTRHQAAMTRALDIHATRNRSSSLDKLWREVERLIAG